MYIDINFDNVYTIKFINAELTKFIFECATRENNIVEITVLIQSANNPFLQDFLNICFGPEEGGEINDFASVHHENISN
jgi:hypothetical protein